MNKLILILLTCVLFSCDNYLDIKPKGDLIPTEVEEYDYILNGADMRSSTEIQHFLNDQTVPWMEGMLGLSLRRMYRYEDQYYTETEDDNDWNSSYKTVFVCNTIIDEMTDFEESIDQKRILAEAKLHRAYKFFLLVNIYGKHYNESSASSDPGIPLILTSDLSQSYTRATVQEVYDVIINDITESIPNLPATQKNRVRPSKAAAHGFLSRVYLYMQNFELAQTNAELSLGYYDRIHDLTLGWYPELIEQNKELTWAKTALNDIKFNRYSFLFLGFNGQNMPDFKIGDARASKFLNFGAVKYYSNTNRLAGVSVPELYLNIAECKARKGEVQSALDDLDHIRKFRFTSFFYSKIDASTVTDIFDVVFKERERELMAQGHRFFDVKRLNAEGKYSKDLVRYGPTGEIARIEANDNKWVVPIPLIIIAEYNENLEQNPR